MLTNNQFKQKQSNFKKWARNDARYYVFKYTEAKKQLEPVGEYVIRLLNSYNKKRLITQFNYSQEQADQILEHYNTEFWRGYEYWQNKKQQLDAKLAKFTPIFQQAEQYAEKIDVSDIHDGFPCGDVILYAEPNSELANLLKNYADSNTSTPAFKYKLPIKLPSYGQCIEFDRRICDKVKEFLANKGITALTHSWID